MPHPAPTPQVYFPQADSLSATAPPIRGPARPASTTGRPRSSFGRAALLGMSQGGPADGMMGPGGAPSPAGAEYGGAGQTLDWRSLSMPTSPGAFM